MKARTKRKVVFFATAIAFAGLQWVSGFPFCRSPDEALFAIWSVVVAVFAASCPLIENDA